MLMCKLIPPTYTLPLLLASCDCKVYYIVDSQIEKFFPLGIVSWYKAINETLSTRIPQLVLSVYYNIVLYYDVILSFDPCGDR